MNDKIISPKFSVIIPTYNRERFIKTAVDSVLSQTYKDFELIVVDDGSNDSTKKILKRYMGRNKFKYIFQQNTGPSGARNRGLKEAAGEYIAFLDSDDRWTKNKLEEVDKCISIFSDIMIFHTQEKWYKNGRVHNPKKKHRKPHGYIFENALKICSVSISTAVVKKELFHIIGNFDDNFPVCEDYDFWLRASLKYPVYLIDKILTVKEGGDKSQLSKIYWGKDKYRIKAMMKLINDHCLNRKQFEIIVQEIEKKSRIYGMGCIKRGRPKEGEYYLNLPSEIKKSIPHAYLTFKDCP